jgi:hypothetical protein
MGLRSRLKNKIKGTLEGVGALAKVIHDEANHPGRPQPHMAARNPLWGGGEVERPDSAGDSVPEDSTGQTIQQTTTDPEADYWFLHDPDGEADDWSKTNPKG